MANEQNTSNNLSLVSQNSKITTVKIIWFSIYTLESLLILLLNSVALYIFLKKGFLVKKSTFLLINLTFADLLVGLTIPVMFAVDFVKDPNFKIAFYLPSLLAAFESLLSLTGIALERVFAIFWPFKHRLLKRSHYFWCITLTWLVAAVISFLLLEEVEGYHWLIELDTPALNYFQISLTLILTIILLSSYFAIWIKVTFFKHFSNQRTVKENKNMAKTLSIVTSLFLVTWWPFNIFETLDDFGKDQSLEHGIYGLVYSNSFLNCIVYSVRMPEFRRELINILRKAKKFAFGTIEPGVINAQELSQPGSRSIQLNIIRPIE